MPIKEQEGRARGLLSGAVVGSPTERSPPALFALERGFVCFYGYLLKGINK
jgi:hypothetical protein